MPRQHGDARRTLVQAEKKAVAEIRVVDEPVTVVVSAKAGCAPLKGHEVETQASRSSRGRALRCLRLPQHRHARRVQQRRRVTLSRGRCALTRLAAATARPITR